MAGEPTRRGAGPADLRADAGEDRNALTYASRLAQAECAQYLEGRRHISAHKRKRPGARDAIPRGAPCALQ